jgi:beta-lactamase regulating signal transducer with metallopeptidase domain
MLASMMTLSSLTVALVVLSALQAIAIPSFVRRFARRSLPSRVAYLLWLRALPAAGAIAFAAGLVLPVFLYYEPHQTDEPVTATLALSAAFGLLLLARAVVRISATWLATTRLAKRWSQSGRAIGGIAPGMPTFAIDDPFPIVAVVGCFTPSLFISERVLAECTADELRAMIAHERAHVAASDNLKRLLLRGCPRAPFTSRLDAAWALAAEEAADRAAAGSNTGRRLDLANALIKLARMAPSPNLPVGVSAFYPGGSIESRVRLLLEPPADAMPGHERLVAAFAAGVVALGFVAFAPAIHAAMEALVRIVP